MTLAEFERRLRACGLFSVECILSGEGCRVTVHGVFKGRGLVQTMVSPNPLHATLEELLRLVESTPDQFLRVGT
jgi:hypothetical protein